MKTEILLKSLEDQAYGIWNSETDRKISAFQALKDFKNQSSEIVSAAPINQAYEG